MEYFKDAISHNPLFQELSQDYLELLYHSCEKRVFSAAQYVFQEGDDAQSFYLIGSGTVAIQLHGRPRGDVVIQTLHRGDILGWSWMVPPHRTRFDAQCKSKVETLAFDGKALREKCLEDHEFGYYLHRSFALIFSQRLEATRMQLLDVYGKTIK